MSVEPKDAARISTRLAVLVLLAFAAMIWWPALDTPFWGDDYGFLQGAHAANAQGLAWRLAFWPEKAIGFWRPLSQDSWWRLVEGTFGADARLAHAASLVLLIAATACVGLLARAIARACQWQQPTATALLAAAIYSVLALHFLPVHWASAANSSILVALTALCLAAWVAAAQAGRLMRVALLVSVFPLLLLALLSKESAVMIPLLMIVLSFFVGVERVRRFEILVWLGCIALCGAWLVVRARIAAGVDLHYELRFGSNLLRNALALAAWLLNVPREALRLAASGQIGLAVLWVAAVVVPMLAAWTIAARSGLRQFGRVRTLAVLAFCVVAYAPYFPLAWNSYAYYAAIAAILPSIVLARGLAGHRHAVLAATLIGLSSWIAVAGSRQIPQSGLMARVQWAEATLRQLERERVVAPLYVHSDDARRFHAIGRAGLAWRLGLPPESVHVVAACPSSSETCLIIESEDCREWECRSEPGSARE